MKSLQILQLSYNQISKIGLTDLKNCIHLKELHLQHNSIISIHPQAFIDLKQLQVTSHNCSAYFSVVLIPATLYCNLILKGNNFKSNFTFVSVLPLVACLFPDSVVIA